jgi:lantibiotic transport system ATP-binding protein
LFQGALQELQQQRLKQSAVEVEVSDTVKAELLLKAFPVRHINGTKVLINYESRERMAEITKTLVREGVDVYQMSMTENDLENLFIQITSEQQ